MKYLTFILAILIVFVDASISFGQWGNTINGSNAGLNMTTGFLDVFYGVESGQENTGGYYNTFLGARSGKYNTAGTGNTFIGFQSGEYNTTGNGNTYVGSSSGDTNNGVGNNGSRNTMIGASAGYGSSGEGNVFLGNEAGSWTAQDNRLIIENSYYNPLIYGNFVTKQVGIGTSNLDNHALSVCGSIRAVGELLLESNNGWCDYVFLSDYNLPSIQEEAQHIQEKGHLLGFQSEAEMDGTIIVGDITKRQQAKIEEMMLHLIKMDEEMTKMKEEIKRLNTENEEMKTKMSKQP